MGKESPKEKLPVGHFLAAETTQSGFNKKGN